MTRAQLHLNEMDRSVFLQVDDGGIKTGEEEWKGGGGGARPGTPTTMWLLMKRRGRGGEKRNKCRKKFKKDKRRLHGQVEVAQIDNLDRPS